MECNLQGWASRLTSLVRSRLEVLTFLLVLLLIPVYDGLDAMRRALEAAARTT